MLLDHKSWPQSGSAMHVLSMVGWTAAGPLATIDTGIVTQNPQLGRRLFGKLVHLDLAGQPGPVVGGADCLAWDYLQDDPVLCISADERTVSVRNAVGAPLFTLPNPGGHLYEDLTLAPDGSRITVQDVGQDHAMLVDRAGHPTELPAGFVAEAWLDANTVFGVAPLNGNITYVSVDQPSRLVDLGFKGVFIGPVTG